MFLITLLIIPLLGIIIILINFYSSPDNNKIIETNKEKKDYLSWLKNENRLISDTNCLINEQHNKDVSLNDNYKLLEKNNIDIEDENKDNSNNQNLVERNIKLYALITSIANLLVSLIIFILFDFSCNQYQFVQEQHEWNNFHLYLGIDGLSIYFVLLTTIITPIALLSNWTSIKDNIKIYVILILLLETLLLTVFLVLDILLFYIFFESILPPLFMLIGIFGSSNKVRASFYLFLYTLLGSLFLLLSILTMYSIMGSTDFDALFKTNFNYTTQLFLFYGVFLAFAVKTPTIFLNTWLLKAHVESPLGGSIILAGKIMPA